MGMMDERPDLWSAAISSLPDATLQVLNLGNWHEKPSDGLSNRIDDIIGLTKVKQDQCEKKFWRFKVGDRELLLRDCATKIITWLHKFKDFGDIASQYEPTYAAIPWAIVRFILQSAISEREQMGAILIVIETASRLIVRCRVYEDLYTPNTIQIRDANSRGCLEQFRKDVIALYSAILKALARSYSTLSKNTAGRALKAIFKPDEMKGLLDDLSAMERRVIDQAQVCESKRNQKATDALESLLRNLDSPLFRIEGNVSKVLSRVAEREQSEILDWVSTIPYGSHHHSVSRQRTKGTGEWLLRHSRFIEWHSTSSSALTLIYGDPGSGKTYLVSRAIDWIRDGLNSNTTDEAFAYFYCNRNEEARRQPDGVLRSFVRQLSSTAKEEDTLHEQLPKLKRSLRSEGRLLDIDKCSEVLLQLINTYPATTLVLDALDECEPESRGELMTVFDDLMERSHSPLKVLISSRRDHDIRSHFQDKPTIEVQATDSQGDIAKFVHEKMAQDKRWTKLSKSLRSEVESTLLEGSQGMFQWAALQIQQILKLKVWTATSVRARLGKLPETLEAAYHEVWGEIERLSPHEKRLAERAFQWVLCAFHPLTAKELTVAVLLDPETDTPDDMEDELDENDVLSLCSNLLCIDPVLQVWRFCHLSAREYYEKHHNEAIRCHQFVAISCLKYLTTSPTGETFESYRHTWAVEAVRERNRRSPRLESSYRNHPPIPRAHALCRCETDSDEWNCFCTYVTNMWPAHVRTQDDVQDIDNVRLKRLLKRFFGSMFYSSNAYRAWLQKANTGFTVESQWRGTRVHPLYEYFYSSNKKYTEPYSLAVLGVCCLGFFNLLSDWWEDPSANYDVVARSRTSLLTMAMVFNQEKIWRFLLQRKVSLKMGEPLPLTRAIKFGQYVHFKALLEAGADVNAVDPLPGHASPSTPLMAAVEFRNEGVSFSFARALLKAGADVNQVVPNHSNRNIFYVYPGFERHVNATALFDSTIGRITIKTEEVEFLLDAGADINLCTPQGTVLQAAFKSKSWDAVHILLKHGATLLDWNSALLDAAERGPLDLVQLCLSQGADVNFHDEKASPLIHAAKRNNLEVVKLLLDAGADVNLVVPWGQGTAFAAADSIDKWKCLMRAGADVNLNNGVHSPFINVVQSSLSYNDKVKAIEYLQSLGADINQVLPYGQYGTALIAATWRKDIAFMQFLLKAGANPHLRTERSSPFYGAAETAQPETVSIMLNEGVDPNVALNERYGSALAAAAFWSQGEIIELLLDAGADINMPLHASFKNLWYAAWAGDLNLKKTKFSMIPRTNPYKLVQLLHQKGLEPLIPLQMAPDTPPPHCCLKGMGAHTIQSIHAVSIHGQHYPFQSLSLDWGHIILELESKQPGRLPTELCDWGFPCCLPISSVIIIGLQLVPERRRAIYALIRVSERGSFGPVLVRAPRATKAKKLGSAQDKWATTAHPAEKQTFMVWTGPILKPFLTLLVSTVRILRKEIGQRSSNHPVAVYGAVVLLWLAFHMLLWTRAGLASSSKVPLTPA